MSTADELDIDVDGWFEPVEIRRRPGSGTAFLFTGSNAHEIAEWVNREGGEAYVAEGNSLWVLTDRGDVEVEPGDRVNKGLVGEFYPITPEAYAAGWEPVGEVSA